MHRIDLCKTPWKFRQSGKPERLPAVVPGCVHTDLLRNRRIPDPFFGTNELAVQWIGRCDWEYGTTFSVPADSLGEGHVELVAEGLDTVASVWLNGKLLARADNMFVAHRWDIRPFVRARGNRLRIVFASAENHIKQTRPEHAPAEFNDPVGRCTVIRKQQCQFGWDWGPRFVTAGIWRPIRIEAWSGNRIESVHISQQHEDGGRVRLEVAPALALAGWSGVVCARLYIDGKLLAERRAETGPLVFDITNPRLWWPAGQGAQPLYTVSVELVDRRSGGVLDQCRRRAGLRTLALDRHADEWGESFQFVINGRPVFAKGANWIPAHSFVGGLKRADYERDLRAAAAANMNMLRVWGGGIYESEDFYDICDELGLLVWQDFMFACSLYPHDGAFLDCVRVEAEQQVKRLQHRACLALWCGNNELPQINKTELRDPDARAGYEALFHQLLPDAVRRFDGATAYWPSSEWRGFFDSTHADGEKSGDTHFWDVWHQRAPVSDYERRQFRFCSEFGMQSYPSLATQATFCPADDGNIFGPVMENHQKNRAGNQIIFDYISRRYRYPKDQASLVYLSQLNQAYCMAFAAGHFRRSAPRCMGALYWQLNDCWPVTSWSSIEFTGRWKAAHHAARRFFAPALVSAKIINGEEMTIGNYRKPAGGEVHLYTIYDAPAPAAGVLRWELRSLDGECVAHGEKRVRLRHGESLLQKKLDYNKQLAAHGGAERLYLRALLVAGGGIASESTLHFTAPRFMELRKAATKIGIRRVRPGGFDLRFVSSAYQHGFVFDFGNIIADADDNYFDLHAGVEKVVRISTAPAISRDQLRKAITFRSLVDSYQ